MAAGTGAGHHSPARTPHDSKTASTRAPPSARYASSAGSAVEVFDPDIAPLIGEDLLDLCLGGGEAPAPPPPALAPLPPPLYGGTETEPLALLHPHPFLTPPH